MSDDAGRAGPPGQEPAAAHPQFLIAHDGKFYLTTGVLAYDPAFKGITDAQRLGVARVAEEHARLSREGWARAAVELPVDHPRHDHGFGATAQHTP